MSLAPPDGPREGAGEAAAPRNELIRRRHEKLRALRAAGVDPFGTRFPVSHWAGPLHARWDAAPEDDTVIRPLSDGGPGFLDVLGRDSVLEREPLELLASAGRLGAYRHDGFWECMDTYKDAVTLNDLWAAGRAPWRIWDREPAGRER